MLLPMHQRDRQRANDLSRSPVQRDCLTCGVIGNLALPPLRLSIMACDYYAWQECICA